MKKIISFSALLVFVPFLAFAEVFRDDSNIAELTTLFSSIIMPILLTISLVYFIRATIQKVMSKNEEAENKARRNVFKGLIVLFVALSFLKIIDFLYMDGWGRTRIDPSTIPCVENHDAGIFC